MKYIRYIIVWFGLMPFMFFGGFTFFKIFMPIEIAAFTMAIFYIFFLVSLVQVLDEEKQKK